ncbi:hypothetical protein D1Q00_gp168 [Trichoplusia ni granulovirus LBIV-12]|uniref:Uncharacterized protein n=2 Tax=Betabaculovirus TaxID=558017 RepID=A0A1D8QLI7_GVTN|nr:hypothetical protein PsunGV_gp179 [Pseudalatia unipuncta granulovirus]YP_009506238.1 hypothetical protein D1Q00_gp168 [Trichoplusia ni granulovirus LBIV-12]ACH69529.1 unknown [Pseudalatia unipuncta granulovirus]AOW41506.1 hypothetical protein [Trichoplusia ni granulovirus LBIV-12]
MSVYNETTIPYNNNLGEDKPKKSLKFEIPSQTKPTLVFSKPFVTKIKDYVLYKKGKPSEIPLYVDEQEQTERCNSTVCTIFNYALLVTCSVLFLGLIAYYSYVGYRSSIKI